VSGDRSARGNRNERLRRPGKKDSLRPSRRSSGFRGLEMTGYLLWFCFTDPAVPQVSPMIGRES